METRRQGIPRMHFDIFHDPMHNWPLSSTMINPAKKNDLCLNFEMVVWFWPSRFEIRSGNRREGDHDSKRTRTIQTEYQGTCCPLGPTPVSALRYTGSMPVKVFRHANVPLASSAVPVL